MKTEKIIFAAFLALIACFSTLGKGFAQNDAIIDYRILSRTNNEIALEVEYIYSGRFGSRIAMGCSAAGQARMYAGYKGGWVQAGRNRTTVRLSLIEERTSQPVRIESIIFNMYVPPSGRRVASKTFPLNVTQTAARSGTPPSAGGDVRPDLQITSVKSEKSNLGTGNG